MLNCSVHTSNSGINFQIAFQRGYKKDLNSFRLRLVLLLFSENWKAQGVYSAPCCRMKVSQRSTHEQVPDFPQKSVGGLLHSSTDRQPVT